MTMESRTRPSLQMPAWKFALSRAEEERRDEMDGYLTASSYGGGGSWFIIWLCRRSRVLSRLLSFCGKNSPKKKPSEQMQQGKVKVQIAKVREYVSHADTKCERRQEQEGERETGKMCFMFFPWSRVEDERWASGDKGNKRTFHSNWG